MEQDSSASGLWTCLEFIFFIVALIELFIKDVKAGIIFALIFALIVAGYICENNQTKSDKLKIFGILTLIIGGLVFFYAVKNNILSIIIISGICAFLFLIIAFINVFKKSKIKISDNSKLSEINSKPCGREVASSIQDRDKVNNNESSLISDKQNEIKMYENALTKKKMKQIKKRISNNSKLK